jgi:HPr kinase/phosphorylase
VSDAAETLHASCVALDGPDGPMALLITGRSGTGKSRLALELISRGAALVADDRTRLRREGARVMASAPGTIAGLIEARGVGLLRLPALDEAPVAFVADLDAREPERLPPPRSVALHGVDLPLIFCGDDPATAAAMAPALWALMRVGGVRAVS